MTVKFRIRTLRDVHHILAAADVVRELTQSRHTLAKRLQEFVATKKGQYRLWYYLSKLVELADQLGAAECEVEGEIVPPDRDA